MQDVEFFKECVQEYYHLEPRANDNPGLFKKYQFEDELKKPENPKQFEHFEVAILFNFL